MFVAFDVELVLPPLPPPPLLDVLLSRTAVFGTNWMNSPASPRATAGRTMARIAAETTDSAYRLPTNLRMFPPFRVVVQTRTERVMRFSAERKTRICSDFVD